jgi:predicted phage tail protein
MGEGMTIRQLSEEFQPEGEIELKATVNAHSVEDDYVVKKGDFVVLYPYIGKGHGKRLFSMVAMIGLAIASHGIGAWAHGLWETGATWGAAANFAAAATMFIGGALISHFTPKANLDMGKYDDGKTTSTYSWSGPQVMEGQNNAIPVIYGKVKVAGQSIAKYLSDDGDKEYLNWLIAAGEGPLTISDIQINDNAASYYTNVQIDTREGTNDQTVIPNFNDTYFTKESNYKLTKNMRVVEVQGNATQGIIVSIEFPAGLFYANNKGGYDEAWVDYYCGYRKKGTTGAFNQIFRGRVSGKTSSAIRRQWRVDNLAAGEYEIGIAIEKMSHDENSNRVSMHSYLTGVTSIVYDDFAYPNIALVGIHALATDQLSGTPSVSFMVERKTVYVYNPHTKQYEEQPANNPAWAAYDYIHECRKIKNIHIGQYEYVVRGADKRLMLYDQFKAWADFCTEKKLYINWADDSEGRIMSKVNQKIAPIGRGYVLWFGTKCGCIFDCVKEPVQLFGMGNIISGTFQEDFLQTSDRANCIELTYTDADNDYNRQTIMVYGDGYDDSDATQKTTSVTYDGITSYEQAVRTAKYLLYCNEYQIRTVSFEASVDAIACQIGDCILVSHDVTRWGYSGRIEKVDGTTLTLPCEIDDLTKSYKIMYRTQDDVLHEKAIVVKSSTNGWTECTVEKWDNDTPQQNDVFSISYSETGVKPFIVRSITRAQDLTRKIECIEYNENIFNENYEIPPIQYDMKESNLKDVIALTAKQYAYIEDDVKYCKLHASWELPKGATECKYEILLSTDGTNYITVRNFYPSKEITVDTEFGKTYYVKVKSIYGGKKTDGTVYGPVTAAVNEAPPVKNLYAYNRYRQQNDGGSRYDIVVKWDVPDSNSYSRAEVWYKTNHEQSDSIRIVSGHAVNEAGYDSEWKYGGVGKNECVLPQAIVGDTYKIAVVSIDKWGTAGDPDTSPQTSILVAMKSAIPDTPNNFRIAFGRQAVVSWDEVANTDIALYEVRTDEAPGRTDNMLARTSGLSATVSGIPRQGVLYLYAKNALGKWSYPAILSYNKAVPRKPANPKITNTMTGFAVSEDEIPADCLGMNVYINNTDAVKTENNVLSYNCEPGSYNVQIAFYDLFGEGPKSETTVATVKLTITNENLKDEAISLEKVDKTIKDAVKNAQDAPGQIQAIQTTVTNDKKELTSQITQNADNITSIVTNLGDKDKAKANYSAIAQMQDDIALRVKSDDVINQINLSKEGIQIDGKLVHVTGNTVFDDNIITQKMLQAANITLDNNLTITGGNVLLNGDGLRLTLQDGGYTQFNSGGISYVDSNGIQYASITKMIIGKAYDGQYIKFAAPWSVPPSVLTVPMSIQTNAMGYDNVNTYIVCEPTEVTANGFRVNNYLRLQSGAYSNVKANIAKTWTSTENFEYTEVRVDGYMVLMDFWQDVFTVTIPASATYFEAPVLFSYGTRWDSNTSTYDDGSTKTTYFMQWGNLKLGHLKDTSYHHVDGWHQIGLQLIVNGETKSTVWSSSVTNYTANTINTTLSATFDQSSQPRTVKIRTIWKGQVRYTYTNNTMQDDVNTINADRNKAAMCWAHLSNLTIPFYKFQSGEAKIARGYAMFLVTDGGTNNYTITD